MLRNVSMRGYKAWRNFSELRTREVRRIYFRNCPKSLGGACDLAPRIAEKALFDPFRPPHSGQIHPRSVAESPFRTVSPRTPVHTDVRYLGEAARLQG